MTTDSNYNYNAASDIDPISSSEKFGVTNSVLSITASTAVFTLRKFLARKPFKCSIQNSRRIVLKEIPISAWPTHCSNAYASFQSSSFNENGFKFQNTSFIFHRDKCFIQNSHHLVLKEIPISAWPIHYSNAYNLFQLSSFNENGCKFPKPSYLWLD